MTTLTTQTTVGEFVAQAPGLSRIFEQHGIDFCCGGKRPLADVCREKGLDATALLQTLTAYRPAMTDAASLANASLTEICDHIEATHHAYVQREMPRLAQMAAKVAQAHGQNHPEVLQVSQIFAAVAAELQSHMLKEERILFPAIRAMEAGDADAAAHCGTVANPIRVMESEHQNAGDALEQLRRLTHGYTPPADACNTFRAFLDGLREFEQDLHEHVHKENNMLFPRAIALETSLRA